MRARSLGWWQVEPGQNIDAECPSLTNQINKSNKTYHNKILCHHLIAIESIPWIVHLQCNKTGPVQVQVQVQSRSRSSPLQFPVKSTQHTASYCFDLSKHKASITFDYASWETGKKWWTIPWPLCDTWPKMKDTMIWWHETPGSGSK